MRLGVDRVAQIVRGRGRHRCVQVVLGHHEAGPLQVGLVQPGLPDHRGDRRLIGFSCSPNFDVHGVLLRLSVLSQRLSAGVSQSGASAGDQVG
jgi:hypothetical protein